MRRPKELSPSRKSVFLETMTGIPTCASVTTKMRYRPGSTAGTSFICDQRSGCDHDLSLEVIHKMDFDFIL